MRRNSLSDVFSIREMAVRNRICCPPMVVFDQNNPDGFVSEQSVEHYCAIAKGGAGLLIQEATCISSDGRLSEGQLGIWDDAQIDGLRAIVDAVHGEGCPIVVQIHHAGIVGVNARHVCPSAYELKRNEQRIVGSALTTKEIEAIEQAFIQSAVRAYKAGYDGVELHGCHSYLLSQFLNSRVNTRDDAYGTDRMLIIRNILSGVRQCTPENFIVGIRIGGFEPTLADGIAHAKALDELGIDFIDVSYGFYGEMDCTMPEGYPHKDIIYAAAEIKKQVSAPVFAVNGIKTPEQAEAILQDTGVDMVDIGRGILVDYNWPRKALAGEMPGQCVNCRGCVWRVSGEKCPGRQRLYRSESNNHKEME